MSREPPRIDGPTSRAGRIVDWWFRDRATGRIVIGQTPNLPLILFGLLASARWLLQPAGTVGTALQAAATLALVWWALDEVVRGVNPWRRVLGAAVLAFQAYAVATALRDP